MPSTITLDKTDPEIAEAISGCVVGAAETITLSFTPETVTDTEVTGTVTSVAYDGEEEPSEQEMEGDLGKEEQTVTGGAKPPAKNPAVAILIGMKGKKA